MATRELLCKKNMDLEFMQQNISKTVTRLTKSGFGIRTDEISKQCLDASST